MARKPTLTTMAQPDRDWLRLYLAPFALAPDEVRKDATKELNAAIKKASENLSLGESEIFEVNWEDGKLEWDTWIENEKGIERHYNSFHPMKWDFLDSNRFGPKKEYYREYRDNQVKSFWAGLTSSFLWNLRLGNINAVARVGSPVAPISDLERIVWDYVTEIDWAAGTVALKDGTTLFDVRMGTGSVTDAKPARAVRLPSDQDRGFSAFVAAVHPEGLDRTVSSSKLATNYAGWVKTLPEARRKEFSSTIDPKSIRKYRERLPVKPEDDGSGK